MVALLQVECLEEVIRTKSFRRAAQSLRISQPAVSGHIAKLERELNLTLLERGAAGSILTPAGHRILPHLRGFAERAELIHRASEEINGVATTTLTIAGSPRLIYNLLPRALVSLSSQFDNLNIRVPRMAPDQLYEALHTGAVELGVVAFDADEPVPDDIGAVEIFDLGPGGVSGPVGHPIVDGPDGPIDPRDLAGEPLVIMSEGRSDEYNERFFPARTRSTVSVVDEMDAGLRLVRRGSGIIFISGVTSYLADPTLPWRGLVGAPNFTVRLLSHATRPLSEPALAAMQIAMTWAASYQSTFRYDPETGRLDVSAAAFEQAYHQAVAQSATGVPHEN